MQKISAEMYIYAAKKTNACADAKKKIQLSWPYNSKTWKATGFTSLRLKYWEINQATP